VGNGGEKLTLIAHLPFDTLGHIVHGIGQKHDFAMRVPAHTRA
jgi:hypothetical protein